MPSCKCTHTRARADDKDIPSKRLKTSQVTAPPITKENTVSQINMKSDDGDEDTIIMMDAHTLKRRGALSAKDLPSMCRHGFRVAFIPVMRDFVGTLGPWENPTEKDVTNIWNKCFPRYKMTQSLRIVVSKVVEDIVHKWRRNMATTAVQCLDWTLKDFSDERSARVVHAAWLLGDDRYDNKRPYYYRCYGDGSQPAGIFQSPIIAVTLATHLSSISQLPKESKARDYPIGALALSILAVKRALTWAKTGTNIPRTSEGHFSRVNWGDHYRLEEGQYVLTETATNVVALVKKLRDVHWKRILAEAAKYAKEKNSPAASKVLLGRAAEGQSDVELEDWDDDFE